MDNINESADLIAAQNATEKATEIEDEGENEKGTDADKGTENDHGNRTDDDSASESGASRRSEVVDYTKSPEYSQLVKEIKQNLLSATRLQLKNLSALVRRVAVLLLEFLGSTTLNIDELLTSYVSIIDIVSHVQLLIDSFLSKQIYLMRKYLIFRNCVNYSSINRKWCGVSLFYRSIKY